MLAVLVANTLGTIAFILPGIFVFILLSMAQPLVLLEDKGIIESLKGSCKLIWGKWWNTFAIMFPLLIGNYWLGFSISFAGNHSKWLLM